MKYCRACFGQIFKEWVDLGEQPLANNLLSQPTEAESFYPLKYMVCVNCELVQSSYIISPEELFGNYLYHSSTSRLFRNHFKEFAREAFNRDMVGKGDLVVDIGSNDGVLLKPFAELGAMTIGVEPASAIAKQANMEGIMTINKYFTIEVAGQIRKIAEDKDAKLITMTNAFAHVDDLDGIIEGVKYLLHPQGRFMIEVAYLPDMLKYGTFDLLYHEHITAWHLQPLERYFSRHGMYIDEVLHLRVHGGSIRIYVKFGTASKNWGAVDAGIFRLKAFRDFPGKMEKRKQAITALLSRIKKNGRRVIGFGAPAKMSVMTNYFDIGPETIDYIIEEAEAKYNLYSPGKHIKIVPFSGDLHNCSHDYIFIFAWNFAADIIKRCQSAEFRGQFIVPFPKLKIVQAL